MKFETTSEYVHTNYYIARTPAHQYDLYKKTIEEAREAVLKFVKQYDINANFYDLSERGECTVCVSYYAQRGEDLTMKINDYIVYHFREDKFEVISMPEFRKRYQKL